MSPVAFAGEHLPERTDFALLPLEEVENPPARYGIALWRTLRGERRFPARGDLNLREIAPIMRHMSLVAVIEGGADFENGFVGDAVVLAHDVPIAHRRFSDVAVDMPALMQGVTPLFRKVVDTGLPLAYRGRTGHDMAHVIYTDFEGVLLPLGESDAAVDHVIYVGTNTMAASPQSPKAKR